MNNLMAARSQMAMSLAFHIVFAVVGIGLPLMMVIAEGAWLRTGNPAYRVLARRWAKGAAILFAVGAVSGTVLSFELGLLWPEFMKVAGPLIGMPFSLEGFAFFTEAIFLGIYLYGWEKVSPRLHWLSGVMVAASGAASGALVVLANAWMNTPVGFQLVGGKIDPASIDPIRALASPAALAEALHMTLAAYEATGFLAAGVHAYWLLRDRTHSFHRKGLAIALTVGGVGSILQPISGDYAAKVVAKTQPAKLAAMEGQFRTERRAPLRIGGFPDVEARETRYAIEIPAGLSILSYGDPNAEVIGLNDFPPADRPDVRIVHPAFQIMVGCGMAMMAVALWGGFVAWRRKGVPDGRLFLKAVLAASPLGMVAIEAGWTVTEVGRQPWIINGVLRTSEAVTPVEGLWTSMVVYTALYLFLGTIVGRLLLAQFRQSPDAEELAGDGGDEAMSTATILALVMLAALTFYALFGGADYGGGVWDLLARGPRAKAQRDLIAHAIGPVWEANHVWLILVVVLLFTAFPGAFFVVMTRLHLPLSLMLIGIVLRGSAFTFRTYDTSPGSEHRWNHRFSIPSVITPILLGSIIGAIASGRLESPGGMNAWLSPFPIAVGLLTLALFAYLAAVYLTLETDDPVLADDFRLRAIASTIVAGILAAVVHALARSGAPLIESGLHSTPWGFPVRITTALFAIAALAALIARRYAIARAAAMIQVVLVLVGCGLALNPYLVPPGQTIQGSAAPAVTLNLLIGALIAGAFVLFPSLFALLWIFKSRPRKAWSPPRN